MKKGLLITIFILLIFFLGIIVWYSPIIFKGYPIQSMSEDITLAKNYHEVGVLAAYNNQGIYLSSNLIKTEGYSLPLSQYLRSFFYAKIFDVFGLPSYHNLVLISIILYALVFVLFSILILYLFGIKIAAIFSLIYIFSPLGWGLAYFLGDYEFCLLFFVLFLLFYFIGKKKSEESKSLFAIILFLLSGIFLAFSSLSKEVTLVFAFALFVFLLFNKFKKQLISIFIPFVLLMMVFWLPSVISGKNIYISLFTSRTTEGSASVPHLHVFPDAYTYRFEKDQFLNDLKNQDSGGIENIETKKILANFGFARFGIIDRLKIGFYILSQHLLRFFSLEDFGGPFILLLAILGLLYLRIKDRFLYKLSIFWLTISLFIFSFVILVSRNHLMDFIWLLILLVALGLFYLFQIFREHFRLGNKISIIFGIIALGLVLYHLILVNHVVLGRAYDDVSVSKSMAYAEEIKKINVSDKDIIAVPGDFPNQIFVLNYLTDKSFVIFRESTLNRLLGEKKTKKALEAFNVKYILGYSDELSKKLTTETGVINIASESLKIDTKITSGNKSFFMNLVR